MKDLKYYSKINIIGLLCKLKFFIYIFFLVLPKREDPKPVEPEEESFLPQWGIAVIVIAMASLLFVVIFGVTVVIKLSYDL